MVRWHFSASFTGWSDVATHWSIWYSTASHLQSWPIRNLLSLLKWAVRGKGSKRSLQSLAWRDLVDRWAWSQWPFELHFQYTLPLANILPWHTQEQNLCCVKPLKLWSHSPQQLPCPDLYLGFGKLLNCTSSCNKSQYYITGEAALTSAEHNPETCGLKTYK